MSEEVRPLVGILTGSASDLPVIQQTGTILDKLEIPNEIQVISAHRNPDLVDEYARVAEQRGMKVIICGAGLAAQIIGVGDEEVRRRLRQFKDDLAEGLKL